MKTIYRMAITALCMVLMITLSGCQLAKEEAHNDKMIGALITTEDLDLFEMEGYLNDHANDLDGNNVTINGNTSNGRLYAEKTKETITSSETDREALPDQYVFPGVYGISFFAATIQGEDETDETITSIADQELSNPNFNYSFGNDLSTSLEGTIYISPSSKEHTFFVNAVYQSEDGSIYVTERPGIVFDVSDESSEHSVTLEESFSTTDGVQSKSHNFTLCVSFMGKFASDKIIVLQFDNDHRLIQSDEYASDNIPEEVFPDSQAAYIIVENFHKDELGNETVFRDIYSQGTETLETFIANDHDICVKQETLINWPSN